MIPDALITAGRLDVEEEPRGPTSDRFSGLRPPAHVVPLLFFALTAAACLGGHPSSLGKALLWTNAGIQRVLPKHEHQHMLRRRELLTDAAEPMSVTTAALALAKEGTIKYVHLWVGEDGMSHLDDCTMQAEDFTAGLGNAGGSLRIVAGNATASNATAQKLTTGMGVWQHSEYPQFLVILAGIWLVNTTDGDHRSLLPGMWLYQDDTERHPAAQPGTLRAVHAFKAARSGSHLSVKWNREPTIGGQCSP